MKPLLIAIFIISTVLIGSDRVLASGSLSPWAIQAVDLVNGERAAHGLPPLSLNEELDQVATAKLSDMEAQQYFAHTSPAGATPWSWFEGVKYDYRYAGENLAIRFKNPSDEHAAWMASEKHCQNILDARFKETGFAVKRIYFDGEETMLAVETFGTKRGDEGLFPGSKEDALMLCKSGKPLALGASIGKSPIDSAREGVAGLLAMAGIPTGNMIPFAEIAVLTLFALAEVSSVTLIVLTLFRREWRNGVVT
jgi:hypothetical protein